MGPSNKRFGLEFNISMFIIKNDFTIHFDFIFVNVKIQINLIPRIHSSSEIRFSALVYVFIFFICGLWDWKRGFMGTREYMYIYYEYFLFSQCHPALLFKRSKKNYYSYIFYSADFWNTQSKCVYTSNNWTRIGFE